MQFMLDTTTCIYIIKRKPFDVIERFRQTEISQIGISSITLGELSYGVSKSSKPEQNQMALTQFVAPLEIFAYGDEAALYYGDLRAHLEKKGTPIGSLDMLIAAHALSIDLSLLILRQTNLIEEKLSSLSRNRYPCVCPKGMI